MRKRFTKIICFMTAAISALGVTFASACGNYKFGGVDMDGSATAENIKSNGGFLVETGDYVYFINGRASNTDDNTFGKVVKGSVQRISKANLNNHNYAETQTVVPSVIYSGYYDAGIYIYGDYIYYTTPSTNKNSDGVVQNQYLEFKRSKLDGSEAMEDYYYQASSTSMEYRYVQVNGKVYLMYATSESLYGSSATNIHSIDTVTGEDTLLAYNVQSYEFDTEDPENPYVYYTMGVTNYLGSSNSFTEKYNQLYRVRADVTTNERTYNFDGVEAYNKDTNPLYINLGDFVLDGIGIMENGSEAAGNRICQFNFNYGKQTYTIDHHDYKYDFSSYRNGELLFTRQEVIEGNPTTLMRVTDKQIDANSDGKVDIDWDAIEANGKAADKEKTVESVLSTAGSTDYQFVEFKNGANQGKKVVYTGDDGIMVGEIEGGKVINEYSVSDASSAVIAFLKEETTLVDGSDTQTETHLYAYYTGSKDGEEGYYRIAVDGLKTDYERNKLPVSEGSVYKDAKLLDIAVASDWYSPEFVGNHFIFASATEGMGSLNYVMAFDMTGKGGNMMSNAELTDYNEKYSGVIEKIEEYDEVENSDGSAKAYENLSNALKYVFYSGDGEYLDELIKAYVDIAGKGEEHLYSKQSAQINRDFKNVEGDWADYATDDNKKTVDGETVYANSQKYYYSVLGKMTEADVKAFKSTLKTTYMKAYPASEQTWWEGLSNTARIFFIVGMVACGLLVIGGGIALAVWLVKRKNKDKDGDDEGKVKVDITDDKSIDVYADENAEKAQEDGKNAGQDAKE